MVIDEALGNDDLGDLAPQIGAHAGVAQRQWGAGDEQTWELTGLGVDDVADRAVRGCVVPQHGVDDGERHLGRRRPGDLLEREGLGDRLQLPGLAHACEGQAQPEQHPELHGHDNASTAVAAPCARP